MESTDVLFSSCEKITFLGNFNDFVVDHDDRPLFCSLGDLFRIEFIDGQVKSDEIDENSSLSSFTFGLFFFFDENFHFSHHQSPRKPR